MCYIVELLSAEIFRNAKIFLKKFFYLENFPIYSTMDQAFPMFYHKQSRTGQKEELGMKLKEIT